MESTLSLSTGISVLLAVKGVTDSVCTCENAMRPATAIALDEDM
jgi:hypothetical protein